MKYVNISSMLIDLSNSLASCSGKLRSPAREENPVAPVKIVAKVG